jgi:hypothetical protein
VKPRFSFGLVRVLFDTCSEAKQAVSKKTRTSPEEASVKGPVFYICLLWVSFVFASYLVRYWFGGAVGESEAGTKETRRSPEEGCLKTDQASVKWGVLFNFIISGPQWHRTPVHYIFNGLFRPCLRYCFALTGATAKVPKL